MKALTQLNRKLRNSTSEELRKELTSTYIGELTKLHFLIKEKFLDENLNMEEVEMMPLSQ